MNREQKLIDICFEIAMSMHNHKGYFKTANREEVAEWVADQLRESGFDTAPCGASWGVLKELVSPSEKFMNKILKEKMEA